MPTSTKVEIPIASSDAEAARPQPLHWAYVLLYMFGVLAALWEHGHPFVTVALLLAAIPMAMAPYFNLPTLEPAHRKAIQHMICAVGLFWGMYRVTQRSSFDLLLIEGFAIMALNFALGRDPKAHGYLLLSAVINLCYGAILRPRPVFVLVMPVAVLLCLALMYHSRPSALAKGQPVSLENAVSRGNLLLMAGHMVVVLAIWLPIFLLMPIRSRNPNHYGALAASFDAQGRRQPPLGFRDWFQSHLFEPGAKGRHSMDGPNPTHSSMNSHQIVSGGQGAMAPGGGGGTPGKDLVMRVKAPAKLYWLANLHDKYTGSVWRTTKELRKQERIVPGASRDTGRIVAQEFTIEKWVSPALYGAFQPGFPQTATHRLRARVRPNYFGCRFIRGHNYPAIPFRYRLISNVSGEKNPDLEWLEELPREHYLELPDRVSERVRQKARDIVGSTTDPLAKAMALRDYLRTRYTYSLKTKPIPRTVETVDYFLFNMDKGHCEYFAAALAVMARAVDLPSRVATGFSPGNYNVLTNEFEVYEYHAHAWTQIYIDDRGWLTMDGTPPGSTPVQSRTTPGLIGNLRDPFSDEWQARAPELASAVALANEAEEKLAKDMREPGIIITTLGKILYAKSKKKHAAAHGNRAGKGVASSKTGPRPGLWARIKLNLSNAFWDAKVLLAKMVTALSLVHAGAGSVVVLGILAIVLFVPIYLRRRRFREQVAICERRYRDAVAAEGSDPDLCITACYKMLRDLLCLIGLPRKLDEELVDYVTALDRDGLECSKNIMAVYVTYFQLQYDPRKPSLRDAASARRHAEEARLRLLSRLDI